MCWGREEGGGEWQRWDESKERCDVVTGEWRPRPVPPPHCSPLSSLSVPVVPTPHHTTPHHTTPHMELTTSTPSHCILQVLLVSPPPPPHHSHHSRHIEPKQSKNHNQTNSKPFSPWKPGDAYSVEQDLSDWRLLLGSIEDGDQTRWDTASDMMVVCSVRFSQSNSRIETHSHLSSQTNHPQINNRIIVDCCCCIEYLILANFIIMLNICKSKFV